MSKREERKPDTAFEKEIVLDSLLHHFDNVHLV